MLGVSKDLRGSTYSVVLITAIRHGERRRVEFDDPVQLRRVRDLPKTFHTRPNGLQLYKASSEVIHVARVYSWNPVCIRLFPMKRMTDELKVNVQRHHERDRFDIPSPVAHSCPLLPRHIGGSWLHSSRANAALVPKI